MVSIGGVREMSLIHRSVQTLAAIELATQHERQEQIPQKNNLTTARLRVLYLL